MKKIFLFAVIGVMVVSCKNVNSGKEPEDSKVVLGADRDEHGCVGSAGYGWSVVLNKCVRLFEEGFRLNPVAMANPEDVTLSAFVIFEEKGDKAELFIPEEKESIILKRGSKEKSYSNNDWSLTTIKGYVVKKGDVVKYTEADVVEKKEIGDDKLED